VFAESYDDRTDEKPSRRFPAEEVIPEKIAFMVTAVSPTLFENLANSSSS
jgi:hypothetical protein